MKTSVKILLAAGLLCGASVTAMAPAAAQPAHFSFRVGEVGMGYHDGYYDQSRQWHRWRNARERRWYQVNYRHQYRGMRHDQDHDGIPDRVDRDRDGDGKPNYRDNAPNNPYRR